MMVNSFTFGALRLAAAFPRRLAAAVQHNPGSSFTLSRNYRWGINSPPWRNGPSLILRQTGGYGPLRLPVIM